MSAEVLGCCQALIELKIFLRAPNNIYFDLKKVLGEAIALYTSPKSGEITFNLSRFWDTCWLIMVDFYTSLEKVRKAILPSILYIVC